MCVRHAPSESLGVLQPRFGASSEGQCIVPAIAVIIRVSQGIDIAEEMPVCVTAV